MAYVSNLLIGIFIIFVSVGKTIGLTPEDLLSSQNTVEKGLPLTWLYEDNHSFIRKRRSSDLKLERSDKKLIDETACLLDVKRLCGALPPESDDLTVLECIQTFKVQYIHN